MTALPVLGRECRIEARRRVNYWLRVLGAAFMVFLFMGFVHRDEQSVALLGLRLFPKFHTALFLTIALIAPVLTADCLAQERREGTLQLLLLTRLTAGGIVAAKSLAHALRGFALVLAALPLLGLPLLLGGVTTAETKISALLCLSVLLLGLAGGMAASALAQAWARATALACGAGWSLLLASGVVYEWCFHHWIVPLTPGGLPLPHRSPSQFGFGVWELLADYDRHWAKTLTQLPRGGQEAWLALLVVFFVSSWLVAVLLVQFSGWAIRQSAIEHAVSRASQAAFNLLAARRFSQTSDRWRRRRLLRRNPIYWLQQRTWSARATNWVWCAAVLFADALLLTAPGQEIRLTGQWFIGLGLVLGLIYASASSYRLEKSNGVFELFFVTPLST